MTSDVDTLVSELQLELDLIDRVFSEATSPERRAPSSSDIFKTAVIEGEKEELEDKLRVLLQQVECQDQQTNALKSSLLELKQFNSQLLEENESLKSTPAINSPFKPRMTVSVDVSPTEKKVYTDKEYKEIEYKLAETRSALARMQQSQDDHHLLAEVLAKELDLEREKRLFAEKERDAYLAAYEASLKHLSRRSKVHKPENVKPPSLFMSLFTDNSQSASD